MANGVKFFPGGTVVYTPGTATTEIHSVASGALVDGVLKTVVHGFGLDDIMLSVRDADNLAAVSILRCTGADPTNSIDIQIDGLSLPGGLTIGIIGNIP